MTLIKLRAMGTHINCSMAFSPPFIVDQVEVRTLSGRLNKRKASSPDNIYSSTLETTPISCVLFPQKTWMITPIPKKSNVSTMDDYRPVAYTSVVMKVFERIVLRYL